MTSPRSNLDPETVNVHVSSRSQTRIEADLLNALGEEMADLETQEERGRAANIAGEHSRRPEQEADVCGNSQVSERVFHTASTGRPQGGTMADQGAGGNVQDQSQERNVSGGDAGCQGRAQEANTGGRTEKAHATLRASARNRVPMQQIFRPEKAWTLPLKCALVAGLLATITSADRSGGDVLRIMFGVVVYLVAIRSLSYRGTYPEATSMHT